MTPLRFVGPLITLCCALFSPSVTAAPLDNSANKKIDEAINVHYLNTDFRKAVALLKGTVKACGSRCSDSVVARAWMYIGIVRGIGDKDAAGAKQAFRKAVAASRDVELDEDLSNKELRALFVDAGGTESSKVVLEENQALPGAMECSPSVTEVETRRPIPVACQTSKPASRVVLHYKEFGSPEFTKLDMRMAGTDWLGQIPCAATGLQGKLEWYVEALSGSGENIDGFGAARMPTTISIVESTTVPPPTHPGKLEPARCSDAGDCPVEMRGTPTCPYAGVNDSARGDKAWGASCERSQECQPSLYCVNEACESPPSCESNADCDSGQCEDFICKMDEAEPYESAAESPEAPKNFFGVKLGFDFAAISGEDVCNPNIESNYRCFIEGEEYSTGQLYPLGVTGPRTPGNPRYEPSEGGSFSGSLAPSTVRVMLSYERIFSDKFGVELQAGLAFSGAPNTETAQLLHLSGYGKYWFQGTGPGLKFYALVGYGLGQVDAHKSVGVREIEGETKSLYCDTAELDAYCDFAGVDAYTKLGASFFAAGAGAFANLGGHGPVVSLVGKLMVPVTGVVIQPTVGWLYGF